MATTLKYWFAHNEKTGYIYESDRFGRVIVFDGILKIGEPFYIRTANRESVTGDEKANLVEMLVSVISESIPNE